MKVKAHAKNAKSYDKSKTLVEEIEEHIERSIAELDVVDDADPYRPAFLEK